MCLATHVENEGRSQPSDLWRDSTSLQSSGVSDALRSVLGLIQRQLPAVGINVICVVDTGQGTRRFILIIRGFSVKRMVL